jgi:hypothetical protein
MNKLILTLGLMASLVFGASSAMAFNPQPDPPVVADGDE